MNAAATEAQATRSYRLLMMQDGAGKVLLIVPANLQLRLSRILQVTGRKLQAISPAALQRFFRQPGMRRPEGHKRLFSSLPLFVDSRVTKIEANLQEASSGLLLDDEAVNAALPEAKTASLGDELPPLPGSGGRERDVNEISRAIETLTSRRISERIDETLSLPTLSPTAERMLRLRSDLNAGVDDLLPIVASDPSLSAQVMAWANSPMFAAPGGAHSLEDAVVRILGYDLVVNLGLSLVVGKELKLPVKGPRGAVPYWQRALATAKVAEQLARLMPVTRRPPIGVVYLTGLLHNFGTLLLGHLFPPQYQQLCDAIALNPHIESWRLERALLGIESAQLAAWLFEHWSLPAELIDAIRWQHQPDYAEHPVLASLLFFCSRLLREEGLSDGPLQPLPATIHQTLGLQYHQVDQVLEHFEQLRTDVQDTVAQLKL